MLEAVARAAAEEPDALVLRMWRDEEVRVARQRVGAGASADERALRREPGSGARGSRGPRCSFSSDGNAILGVGVEVRPLAVGARLEAAPVEVADSVDAPVEVDPSRERTAPASRRERRRSRRPAASPAGRRRPGKSPASQAPPAQTMRSASRRSPPTETVSPSGAAVPETKRAPLATACSEITLVASRARSTPGLRLVEDRVEALAVEAREEPRSFVGRRGARPGSPSSRSTRSLSAPQPSASAEEPGDAARDEELGAGVPLELAPELERPPRRARVPGVAAVRGADQPRLAAGGGADVAGRVLLDEGDLPAAGDEPQGERAAEDAGADDDRARQAAPAPPARLRAARPRAPACPCAGSARVARPRGPARSRSAREGLGGDDGWEWKTASS